MNSTHDFQTVVKTWNQLTSDEKKEVATRFKYDDILVEEYLVNEKRTFDKISDEILDAYSDYIKFIDLEWVCVEGDAIQNSAIEIILKAEPPFRCDMSEFGYDDVLVELPRTIIIPRGDTIKPQSKYFKFTVDEDYNDVTLMEVAPYLYKCEDVINVMKYYSKIIDSLCKEYWSNIEQYCSGYESLAKFGAKFVSSHNAEFVFRIWDDGVVECVDYTY